MKMTIAEARDFFDCLGGIKEPSFNSASNKNEMYIKTNDNKRFFRYNFDNTLLEGEPEYLPVYITKRKQQFNNGMLTIDNINPIDNKVYIYDMIGNAYDGVYDPTSKKISSSFVPDGLEVVVLFQEYVKGKVLKLDGNFTAMVEVEEISYAEYLDSMEGD